MSVIFNQSWPGKGRSSNFRNVHKKYTVSSPAGHYAAKTDTLAEAKQAGSAIAKQEAWRGKWNVPYIRVDVLKQADDGSVFYVGTGWRQYVPVRGTGKSTEAILALMSRHGVAPFKWTKR